MINQKRLVSTFLDLVKIDSPSGEEKNLALFVEKKLKELGGKVEYDNYGNLIAKFKGVGAPFMLNAHLDTVEPGRGIKPIIDGDKIKSDGATILGGDDKAGIAVILEALTSLKDENKLRRPIEAVFTLEEETGLLGALNLDYSKITSKHGVTFDGDENVYNITISAPGYYRIDATITGKSAHSGMEPEKGISAIKIAAEIITQLEVGRIDHETTANIGMIEGGSARNAIPEKVSFMAEIRSRSIEKLEKHSQHFEHVFERALANHPDAKIVLNMHKEFDPYVFEETHIVISLISKILKSMNLSPKLMPSGGATDVNIFHTHGIEMACVGTGNHDAHTTREYVVISEMVQAARACERLVTS